MADRNLPIISLPSAPEVYNQADQDSLRLAIRQHWHPGTSGGSGGGSAPVTAFATVLLSIDNGSSPIVDGTFVTAPITFQYTIVSYRLIDDCGFAGSIQLRIDYASADAYPTFTEISGTQRPQLVAARESQRTTLDGWTQVVGQAYSQLRATVIGDATDLTRIELAIGLQRTDAVVNSSSGGGGSSTDDDSGITGSVWHDGVGAPSAALGNNGDYYLNDTTRDIYAKSGGTWTIVASMKNFTLDPLWNLSGEPLCNADGNTLYSG